MVVLMLAAIAGGIVTAGLVAPAGMVVAVLAAPFGGSLCALAAGLLLATRRTAEGHQALDTTDQQVAALRSVLQAAYPAQTQPTSNTKAGRAAA
jgi:hypothetical protein